MAAGTRQLNVSITLHFSKLIRQKVQSGRYANASEVVRDALRKLEQEDLPAEQSMISDPEDVVTQVRIGMESIAKGRQIELRNEQELRGFFSDIIKRGNQRFDSKRKQRSR